MLCLTVHNVLLQLAKSHRRKKIPMMCCRRTGKIKGTAKVAVDHSWLWSWLSLVLKFLNNFLRLMFIRQKTPSLAFLISRIKKEANALNPLSQALVKQSLSPLYLPQLRSPATQPQMTLPRMTTPKESRQLFQNSHVLATTTTTGSSLPPAGESFCP